MKRFPFLPVLVAAALIAAVFIVFERFQAPRQDQPVQRISKSAKTDREKVTEETSRATTTEKHVRRVAIIIDDIGFDLNALRLLTDIPAPIAFSVLPYTPHSAEAVDYLYRRKREILLHLPMEPLSYPRQTPGPGALMINMDDKQIRRQLWEDLSNVRYVSGVNNHMGSRFMEDFSRLCVLMEELKKRNLYFIDSRTTPRSKGRQAAATTGIRFAARDIFIDHQPGYEAAYQTLLNTVKQNSNYRGPLLFIGHPHADTIRAITAVLPLWRRKGIEIVDVKTVPKRVDES